MAVALREIAALRQMDGASAFRNELAAALCITAAAFCRAESRGGHYRSDFPDEVADWRHRTTTSLSEAEAILGAVRAGRTEVRIA